jgi:hypothetical protein
MNHDDIDKRSLISSTNTVDSVVGSSREEQRGVVEREVGTTIDRKRSLVGLAGRPDRMADNLDTLDNRDIVDWAADRDVRPDTVTVRAVRVVVRPVEVVLSMVRDIRNRVAAVRMRSAVDTVACRQPDVEAAVRTIAVDVERPADREERNRRSVDILLDTVAVRSRPLDTLADASVEEVRFAAVVDRKPAMLRVDRKQLLAAADCVSGVRIAMRSDSVCRPTVKVEAAVEPAVDMGPSSLDKQRR